MSDENHVRSELEKMLAQYAPKIWWHSSDPYPPMDPLEFIDESELYFRSRFGHERKIASLGQVQPEDLKALSKSQGVHRPYQSGFALNGSGYFLRHADQVRPLSKNVQAVPIFWRLSEGPMAQRIAESAAGHARVFIEYWYHVGFNWANASGLGNHQGDWEGVSMLIDLWLSEGHLQHKLLASFFSEHEGGRWLCAKDLEYSKDDSHPVAYSAQGTHATYPSPGAHPTPWLTDQTEAGWSWDTWKNVRPLELEPYYGYAGAWGEPRMFSFMTGPLVPGPGTKWLPRDSEAESFRTYARLAARCRF